VDRRYPPLGRVQRLRPPLHPLVVPGLSRLVAWHASVDLAWRRLVAALEPLVPPRAQAMEVLPPRACSVAIWASAIVRASKGNDEGHRGTRDRNRDGIT
jgi:hypothetical protein